jgi:hypothetical protein
MPFRRRIIATFHFLSTHISFIKRSCEICKRLYHEALECLTYKYTKSVDSSHSSSIPSHYTAPFVNNNTIIYNTYKLVAIYNVYNEEQTIKDSISTIIDYVDEVHVYDGAWAPYDYVPFRSTDRTQQIVEALGPKIKFFETERLYGSQWEKRSVSLSGLNDGDYFIWLDGDEMVLNPKFLVSLDYGLFDIAWAYTLSNIYDSPYATPRVIRYVEGMHYDGKHFWIVDNNKNIIVTHHEYSSEYRSIDVNIRIFNMRHTRGDEYKRQYNDWAEKQLDVENERAHYLWNRMTNKNTLVKHDTNIKDTRKPTYVIAPMNGIPAHSMLVTFSRPWAIDRWFTTFDTIIICENTELFFIYDGDDKQAINDIMSRLKNWKKRYNGIKFYASMLKNFKEYQTGNDTRRSRIIHNWHIFLTEAMGKYMLGAEDDTLPDNNDVYITLMNNMNELPNCGFVQALEVGRWKFHCFGSYKIIDDINGNMVQIETDDREKGITEIQGGGWYCFAMLMNLARAFELKANVHPDFGPDVRLVYDIHKSGFKCYTNHDLKCTHFTETQDLHPDTTKDIVKYIRKRRTGWMDEYRPVRCLGL